MTYRAYIDGKNPKTKKELKDAIKANPTSENIFFENLNLLGETRHAYLSNFPPGRVVDVVGPDPERDRRWYATVQLVNGKVIVT